MLAQQQAHSKHCLFSAYTAAGLWLTLFIWCLQSHRHIITTVAYIEADIQLTLVTWCLLGSRHVVNTVYQLLAQQQANSQHCKPGVCIWCLHESRHIINIKHCLIDACIAVCSRHIVYNDCLVFLKHQAYSQHTVYLYLLSSRQIVNNVWLVHWNKLIL